MQAINFSQKQKLTTLLVDEDEIIFINHFTCDRKSSIEQLTKPEADCLIILLSALDQKPRYYTAISKLAFALGIMSMDGFQSNGKNLSVFLKTKGVVQKDLKEMRLDELIITMKQMEKMLAAKNNKAAKTATNRLLEELNLTVK